MPIAHLSVAAGFRRAEVSSSSFIVCVHGERISVCLRPAAPVFFFESDCESSLFPDPHFRALLHSRPDSMYIVMILQCLEKLADFGSLGIGKGGKLLR